MTPLSVPHFQAAVGGQPEAVIVALGSSSTEGVAATDQAHDYPAILQATLSSSLPHAHIAVINRGIGGQDAPEELARLDADVIAIRPQLVIWQVGANGAMRGADPTIFKHMVTEGVNRLHQAKIDVVLMDNQRAPHVDASPDNQALVSAMAEIAHETGASLFSRGALMDAWTREGAPETQFISSDGVHHNNRGYYCMATQLAASIVSAVRRGDSVTASR